MLGTVNPNANTINYTYDSLNQLIVVTYPGHLLENCTYDSDGNTKVMSDSSGTTYYAYDARDRLTNETQVNTVSSSKITSTFLYSYDATSNIVSITYPDSTVLNYKYDALNRITSVGSYATFTYTLDNQIKSIAYDNGITTSYTYDSMDRPLSITSSNSSHTFQTLTYQYDSAGNLVNIDSGTYAYTYDNLNRLNSSTGPWGTIDYTYDPAGNRVKMVQGSTTVTYTYNAYNRLYQATDSASTATYTFNHNGDLTKLVNGSNTWNYYYNYDNDLIGVTKNSANVQNSTYNAQGSRITNTIGSSTAVFAYQGSNILYQDNVSATTTIDYFFANGIQISDKAGSSNPTYFLVDNLGSTRITTSSAGDVQFGSDYKPFGVPYGQSGTPIPQQQYTGKMTDAQVNSGIYYIGARYYDTNSGRFITEDSNTGSLSDPMSLNRYIYGEDDPMATVDPTGHIGYVPPHSAQSNNAQSSNPITSALSSAASSISNWWSGLSPLDQQIIIVGASLAITLVTAGIAAPLAAGAIGTEVGTDAALEATGEIAADAGADTIGATASDATTSGLSQSLDSSNVVSVEQSTSNSWGNSETLEDHFFSHGADFGSQNAEEYANQAQDFLQQGLTDRFPTKVDLEGVVRIYDPETNTFGSYNPDLTTRTFFKPSPDGSAYWADQPGFSPWI